MAHRSRVVATLLLLIAAAAPVAVPAVARVDGGVHGGTTDGRTAGSVASPSPTPDDNVTRHENPDSAGEDGQLGDVSEWLERKLARQLTRGAININQQQYDLARRVVGTSYDEQFRKYVDVAGETATERDDRTGRQYREAKREQRKLANLSQEYWQTYREYREAKRTGNTERARRLARKLQRLARRIKRLQGDLNRTFTNISNRTGVDMGEAKQNIRAVEQNVTRHQRQVRKTTFVTTRLRLQVADRRASFTDPLVLRGRLTTANGTAISNRSIALAIGTQVVTTRTNATGAFSIAYRPTLLPTGTQTVAVHYHPRNVSIYLGASENVTVNVTQVAATARIKDHPESVAFGDTVTVRGRVVAEDVGAAGVPVVVWLGEVRLGTARTGPNGRFAVETTIPATVTNGSRELRVAVPMRGRALAVSNATRRVAVESTATSLSVTATNTSDGVRVAGRLTTAEGEAVSDRSLAVLVDGRRVTTARTGPNGSFSTVVPVAAEAGNVTVVVVFDGTGTNLVSSRTSAVAELGARTSNDGTWWPLAVPLPWAAAILTAAILVVGGAVVRMRGRGERAATDESGDGPSTVATGPGETSATDPGTSGGAGSDPTATADPDELLQSANTRLAENDYEVAVRAAYLAARRSLVERLELDDAKTHVELLAAIEAALDEIGDESEGEAVTSPDGSDDEPTATGDEGAAEPDTSDVEAAETASETASTEDGVVPKFRTLTDAYERVAFAPSGVGRATALRMVGLAEDVVAAT